MSASLVTSASTARTSPSTFSTAATLCRSVAAARSTSTTRAPSDAKRTAAARPMPPAPPVMSTTFPVNRAVMTDAHLALGADSTQAWGDMTEDEGLKALLGGDANAAARAEAALWEMWHRSGDREIDALLREGVAVMERRARRFAVTATDFVGY